MEPKKRILYHSFDKEIQNMHQTLWTESLWQRLNRFTENLQVNSYNPDFIVVSPEVVNMINSMYEVDEVEVSDLRIENDTYVQDILLKPKKTVDNINLNITVDKWHSF